MFSLNKKTKRKSHNTDTTDYICNYIEISSPYVEANRLSRLDQYHYPLVNHRDNNRFNAEHSFDYFSIKAISF